jgi:hypothetical protein
MWNQFKELFLMSPFPPTRFTALKALGIRIIDAMGRQVSVKDRAQRPRHSRSYTEPQSS